MTRGGHEPPLVRWVSTAAMPPGQMVEATAGFVNYGEVIGDRRLGMARSGNFKKKDEFTNVAEGMIGVVTIDGRGDHHGIPVAPGESVWLSEEEQIATANAPRNDEDNPFANGALVLRTRGAEIANRRPYGASAGGPVAAPDPEPEPEETGAVPEPVGEPEEGQAAEHEEVATPAAVEAPKRGPGRPRKQVTA